MSQQPPPLPTQDEQHSLFTEPPPLPLQHDEEPSQFTEPPPLPFMQPPALPAQEIAASPVPSPPKEGRLNPNVMFLLGIWVGIGLCAVAFCFLAISGRFEPFVRWIQRTSEQLESSEPSSKPGSPIAEKDDPEGNTPETPESAEKPEADSEQQEAGIDP